MPRSTTAWLMASVSVACSATRPSQMKTRLRARNMVGRINGCEAEQTEATRGGGVLTRVDRRANYISQQQSHRRPRPMDATRKMGRSGGRLEAWRAVRG